MRIPTNEEYNRLLDTAGEDDCKIHWEKIYSWVDDKKKEYSIPPDHRAVWGYYSARHWHDDDATHRGVIVGFRPAFDLCEVDTLAPEGMLSIVGTLYMDGEPIEVPTVPTYSGDVTGYAPGAKLEIRPPLRHPGYIVTGYRIGDVVIADRVLLTQISYEDVEGQFLRISDI